MKIFSGGEKLTDHNTKIRQLLGEGTGGRKMVSSSNQNMHWREIAKQTIKDLAGGQKDSGRNYAYLAKFKESLDQRQVKNPASAGTNLFNQSRSKSEDPRNVKAAVNGSAVRAAPKLDITSKHLFFEKRRFSDSRPQSASRPQLSDRPSHVNPLENFSLKQSKVQDVLGSLQQSRTLNYSSFQDQIRIEKISQNRHQNSSKHIRTEVEKSAGKFDNLYATPASNKRPRTAKDRLMSSLERKSFNNEKSDYKPKNYLTPKAKLVFNKKAPETDRFSKIKSHRENSSAFSTSFAKFSSPRVDGFIDLRREILNSQPSDNSRYNKLKLSDPRAEYTKRFLQNALARGTPVSTENSAPQKGGSILGEWFKPSKAK